MEGKSVSVVRRLCAPPPSSPSPPPPSIESHNTSNNNLYISDGIPCGGVPPLQEQLLLVSSSFLPPLREYLPLAEGNGGPFGGLWFWESYRRMLWGCDVLVNLSGTGVSLSEDTIQTQKRVRRKAVESCHRKLLRLVEAAEVGVPQYLMRHPSAKLEVLFATALSVVLHVVQQPILEKSQGPQALVLCATKDQCDEFTHILNYFCAELHLVVHNLFDLFPSIPSDRRAEIVVGTPPLWDNVIPPTTAAAGATRRVGLEDLLSVVYDGPPPTYVTTRWRPYTAQFISQLVLFDVEQQAGLGFTPLLTRWLRNEGDGALPRDHQLYLLMGTGHVPYVQEQKEREVLLRELDARLQRSRGRGHSVVELGLCPTLSAQTALTSTPPPASSTDRKRAREEEKEGKEEYSEESQTQPSASAVDRTHLTRGLLVRKALSFPRLALDASAVEELKEGIGDDARDFWCSYDADEELAFNDDEETAGKSDAQSASDDGSDLSGCSDESGKSAMDQIVKFKLAFVCTPVAAGERKGASLFHEVCLLVVPGENGHVEKMRSRYTLLFKHLEEKRSGALFDGSVLSFVNLEDVQLGVVYESISPDTICDFDSSWTDIALDFSISEMEVIDIPRSIYLRAVTRTPGAGTGTQRADELAKLRTTRQKVCKYFEREEGTHRDAKDGDAIDQIPIGTFLPDWDAFSHPFSVMVLRGFTISREALCSRSPSGQKPLALLYLEEYTQYGRLVSYYCFEEKYKNDDYKTSLFLEFSSHEAAAEALRMFNFRREKDATIKATLFRLGVYYAGVEEEEQKRFDSGNDSDDLASWFGISLLAENETQY